MLCLSKNLEEVHLTTKIDSKPSAIANFFTSVLSFSIGHIHIALLLFLLLVTFLLFKDYGIRSLPSSRVEVIEHKWNWNAFYRILLQIQQCYSICYTFVTKKDFSIYNNEKIIEKINDDIYVLAMKIKESLDKQNVPSSVMIGISPIDMKKEYSYLISHSYITLKQYLTTYATIGVVSSCNISESVSKIIKLANKYCKKFQEFYNTKKLKSDSFQTYYNCISEMELCLLEIITNSFKIQESVSTEFIDHLSSKQEIEKLTYSVALRKWKVLSESFTVISKNSCNTSKNKFDVSEKTIKSQEQEIKVTEEMLAIMHKSNIQSLKIYKDPSNIYISNLNKKHMIKSLDFWTEYSINGKKAFIKTITNYFDGYQTLLENYCIFFLTLEQEYKNLANFDNKIKKKIDLIYSKQESNKQLSLGKMSDIFNILAICEKNEVIDSNASFSFATNDFNDFTSLLFRILWTNSNTNTAKKINTIDDIINTFFELIKLNDLTLNKNSSNYLSLLDYYYGVQCEIEGNNDKRAIEALSKLDTIRSIHITRLRNYDELCSLISAIKVKMAKFLGSIDYIQDQEKFLETNPDEYNVMPYLIRELSQVMGNLKNFLSFDSNKLNLPLLLSTEKMFNNCINFFRLWREKIKQSKHHIEIKDTQWNQFETFFQNVESILPILISFSTTLSQHIFHSSLFSSIGDYNEKSCLLQIEKICVNFREYNESFSKIRSIFLGSIEQPQCNQIFSCYAARLYTELYQSFLKTESE